MHYLVKGLCNIWIREGNTNKVLTKYHAKGLFELKLNDSLICPKCQGVHFKIKREATYLYSYNIETPEAQDWSKEDDSLPFLFDYREQLDGKEYLECQDCGAKYHCELEKGKPRIHMTILQKAIRSDFVENPDYLG
jgi:phage FluMu protein Com